MLETISVWHEARLVMISKKLIILDIGQKPYILTRPRGIIRSVSGEPLLLHCLSDGSPRPRIYWTIPGGHTLTRPQVLGRYKLLENGTLIVQDTTLHDQGNYICRARNDAGEAGLTVPVVIIAYPPRITTGPPPSVRAVTGTSFQLNCAATGIPKPDIIWELPDHSVLSAAQQGRRTGSELGSLAYGWENLFKILKWVFPLHTHNLVRTHTHLLTL
uniref:Ig-like domain-containing protein n=1 Tax=Amphiprion percula TaxID=161767 RepID=A0A3P8RMX4_AMPPE